MALPITYTDMKTDTERGPDHERVYPGRRHGHAGSGHG